MKTVDEFPGSISLPYGIKMSHTWHEAGQILRIINDYDVEMFVELGTHVGGLASLLLPISGYRKFTYLGVEADMGAVDTRIAPFVYDADILTKMSVEFIGILSRQNKSIIYCDGGNKIAEMLVYFNQLKPGNIIMCHDYYDGQDVVGLKGFGTDPECGCKPEIWKKDIERLFVDHTLQELPSYLLEGTRIMGFMKL